MPLTSSVLKLNGLFAKIITIRNSSLKAGTQYIIPEERKKIVINENIDLTGNFSKKKVIKRKLIKKPELIIFDKDGTLICFHAMWVPWVIGYVERIEKISGVYLSSTLYSRLGFCIEQRKVIPGLLAEGTMKQIKDTSLNVLMDYGVPNEECYKIINKVSKQMDEEQKNSKLIEEITDIRRLFITLKNDNIKIAICTSDSRKNTIQTLSFL
uniref:HAD family hydrolase n=1 Tax=Strongyloides papillosus TaxID=174720 RepID=A0A0N5C3E6_STREA